MPTRSHSFSPLTSGKAAPNRCAVESKRVNLLANSESFSQYMQKAGRRPLFFDCT